MKLEASLKHFSPQGMHISDDVKSTSPNRLNEGSALLAAGRGSGWRRSSVRRASVRPMSSWQFRRWRDMPLIQPLKTYAKPLGMRWDAAA